MALKSSTKGIGGLLLTLGLANIGAIGAAALAISCGDKDFIQAEKTRLVGLGYPKDSLTKYNPHSCFDFVANAKDAASLKKNRRSC